MDVHIPPHRTTTSTSSSNTTTTTTTTSELFICFTSRLSHSSSMRLTSKSILSPNRDNNNTNNNSKPPGGAPSHSLSSSLSRRLRHNGSLRGAQSPAMLKVKSSRGGFEGANAEPSSPKVTCIGQVRVKTKKQGKKMMKMKNMRAAGASCRSNSKRLIGTDSSFRRLEENQQQAIINNHNNNNNDKKWVHIPMTICEALRTFGAEFSCLLPCKSSCFSSSCNNNNSEGEKRVGEEREGSGGGGGGSTSCGAVFRWLLALEEEEEGKGRDIELVVEGRERVECTGVGVGGGSSRRRSIFDDMDFQDEIFNDGGRENEGNVNGGRVSVCVPPKNALLLMRCRSDPVKMASLSHKIWDSGNNDDDGGIVVVEKDSDDEGDDGGGGGGEGKGGDIMEVEKVVDIGSHDEEVQKGEDDLDMMVVVVGSNDVNHDMGCEDLVDGEKVVEKEEEGDNKEELEIVSVGVEDEDMEKELMMDANEELEGCSIEEEGCQMEGNNKVEVEEGEKEVDLEVRNEEKGEEDLEERGKSPEGQESSHHSQVSSSSSCSSSSDDSSAEEDQSTADSDEDKKGSPEERDVKSMAIGEEEEEQKQEETKLAKERSSSKAENADVLPDCLLLMMCEPKLSMEVSKETWVCSTDFIKWLPDRHQIKKGSSNNKDEPVAAKAKPVAKKKDRINTLPAVQESLSQFTQPGVIQGFQPARSSISVPVASLIEKKLMKAGVGYEPFVLTRCKSAPHRSAVAAKIAPPMPEMGCGAWRRENGRQLEPHRPASAAGVGF